MIAPVALFCERDHFYPSDWEQDTARWKNKSLIDLGNYKTLVRMLLHELWSTEDQLPLTTWCFIDSIDGYMENDRGCMDVSFIKGIGQYRPLPPRDTFYAGVFRSCDPYLPPYQDILPMFRPGSILVFDWLDRYRPEFGPVASDNRDSRIFDLIADGTLIPLIGPNLEESPKPQLIAIKAGHTFSEERLESARQVVEAFDFRFAECSRRLFVTDPR